MWLDPNADGCIYDTVDCFHDCEGCDYAYRSLGGNYPDPDYEDSIDFTEEFEDENSQKKVD